MAKCNVEGDTKDLSERQLEFILSEMEKIGFKDKKVEIQAVGKPGDNYLANIKRLIVEKDGGESLQIIVKLASAIEPIRNSMNTELMFRNEQFMYEEVLPKFEELQTAYGIPDSERLRYAKCYGSFTEAPHEVILLEDLQLSNFEMLDRFKTLTDETVRLILKSFARLHSLSYALKHIESETYAALRANVVNSWLIIGETNQFRIYFEQLKKDTIMVLDEKYKSAAAQKLDQILSKIKELHEINSKWDEKAVDCCMIDYQVSKEGSPVADILYMIFNCTDHETRLRNYYIWLDYYHAELDKELTKYGLQAKDVYPRDQMDNDLRINAPTSFIFAVLFSSMVIRKSADAEKLMNALEENGEDLNEVVNVTKIGILDPASILRFKNRVEGLLDSFIEFGYM